MNLKTAFDGMKQAETPAAAKRAKTPATAKVPLPQHGTAKSKHPEFEAVKVYLRKETRKRAARKFEDTAGGDFSDLVQQLLEKYLGS